MRKQQRLSRFAMRAFLLLTLFAASAAAQPVAWVNKGGPPGGTLPVLHETAEGTLLAVDEIGRLIRSADGGKTWQALEIKGTATAPLVVVR